MGLGLDMLGSRGRRGDGVVSEFWFTGIGRGRRLQRECVFVVQ